MSNIVQIPFRHLRCMCHLESSWPSLISILSSTLLVWVLGDKENPVRRNPIADVSAISVSEVNIDPEGITEGVKAV